MITYPMLTNRGMYVTKNKIVNVDFARTQLEYIEETVVQLKVLYDYIVGFVFMMSCDVLSVVLACIILGEWL